MMHTSGAGVLLQMVTLAATLTIGATAIAAAEHGLTAQVYANSVMRGTPACTFTVQNGFKASAQSLCGPKHAAGLVPGQYSIRLTGMLTAAGAASSAAQWHKFTSTVGPSAMVRLWVDDHRLVDAWDPKRHAAPGHAPAAPAGYSALQSTDMPASKNEFPASNNSGKLPGTSCQNKSVRLF